jgi:hypothetical protein
VLGVTQARLFGAGITNTNYFDIYFPSGNQIRAIWYDGAQALTTTTAVFRDPSAWYHVVVAVDTTQATASNRIKIYVNSIEQIRDAVNPNQNLDTSVNSTVEHGIGRYVASQDTVYFDGYLTEINFIDGQALTPSSFGEFNSDTGVWQPKAYTGSYGTNGFYLDFADNSGTTSTTLGADSSGNGNNWTPNNFSVTAGAGNDSLVDSPTRYGTDTGAGGTVRGNYATLNPLDKGSNITLTNGNLQVSSSSSPNNNCRGTFGMSSGKWYFEFVITSSGGTPGVGIGSDTASLTTNFSGALYLYLGGGDKVVNGAESGYGASYTTNDVIGIAFDADSNSITFYKNNISQGAITGITSGLTWRPFVHAATSTIAMNFGQRPFAYTAPSGFKALVTTNLPTPTIEDGGEYFNTVLYTGNGGTINVTGVGFQPDTTWIKNRSRSSNHRLTNSVIGVDYNLIPNSDDAEKNDAEGIDSFDSDGFTITRGSFDDFNTSGDTYVAWNWKANGAGVSNTAGTITSTVSVNTTSGFSIVTYTGTGSAATIGHGLGAVPRMIIVKNRDAADAWQVYHAANTAAPETDYLVLNTDAATADAADRWNDTLPTSTVFSIGNGVEVNTNTEDYVAYCFAPVAGYSAFGSYTGNNSTDGPFVYTGFRPAFVMIKLTDDSGGFWVIQDTARSLSNPAQERLFPNASNAEGTSSAGAIDILSNGFKLRNASASWNNSGVTYIYMAFSEVAFNYSLGR